MILEKDGLYDSIPSVSDGQQLVNIDHTVLKPMPMPKPVEQLMVDIQPKELYYKEEIEPEEISEPVTPEPETEIQIPVGSKQLTKKKGWFEKLVDYIYNFVK